MNEENKRRLISAVITLLLSMMGVGVLFVIALPYPDPPPPEYGVEMNMTGALRTATIGSKCSS